jgi:hypothetical protein
MIRLILIIYLIVIQAICTDGSGCSCNWGWEYNATRTGELGAGANQPLDLIYITTGHGHCLPLCSSHCQYSTDTPCMQSNDG